jgi:Cu(I)/Ag(I) efflux system membrane fusion protein
MSSTKRTLLQTVLAAVVAAAAGGPACRTAPTAEHAAVQYSCPMHPQIVRDAPGDCPICGMRLEKRETATPPPRTVAGRTAITLSPERRQLLGIRTEEAREQEVSRELATVGRVAIDERRIHHQHAKLEGYVERLHVGFTGQLVERGEPLLAIYSPELLATQQEYLAAYRAQQRMAGSAIESVARGGHELLAAARERLLLWDIRPQDIERLEKTGEVRHSLDLHAEKGGYVVEKSAFHGMRVTPADTLFKIADLSHLWVLADIYEGDLPAVRLGQSAEVTAVHAPGRKWQGPVTWIAPTVDAETRTIKVRVEIDNPGDVLKPDMFADVRLHGPRRRALVVPDNAVVQTGERHLVFVDHGDGAFEPRPIVPGVRSGDLYEIRSGLAPGERVVTSANFLLDSESSLKAAISALEPGTAPADGATADPHAEHRR